MAFHAEFHTAFVADCGAESVGVIGVTAVREGGQRTRHSGHCAGSGAYFFESPFGIGCAFAAFKSGFGKEKENIGCSYQAVVERAARVVVQTGYEAMLHVRCLVVVVRIAEVIDFDFG